MLCLHGITGTPFEVRPLAEQFGRLGCSVEAPMLAGHGGTLADLTATHWSDWFASAEAALARLEARTGGGPRPSAASRWGAFCLCAWRTSIPPASRRWWSCRRRCDSARWRGIRTVARLPVDFRVHPRAAVPKLKGSDVSDPAIRYTNPGLRAFPIAALQQLLDLMDVVRPDLPAIRTPVLVVHGRKDHTVPMEDSLELTGSLGSDVIERLWLDRSFHLVAQDVERATLLEGAVRFLDKHAGWSVVA